MTEGLVSCNYRAEKLTGDIPETSVRRTARRYSSIRERSAVARNDDRVLFGQRLDEQH